MRILAILALLMMFSSSELRATPILVVPTDFKVFQRSLGGNIEIKDDETAQTRSVIDAALLRRIHTLGDFEPISLPALSDSDRSTFEEHKALFNLVAGQAALVLINPEWQHKQRQQFDYSIGPGLAFLADRTGAEQIIFVSGHLTDSTGGREVFGVVASAIVRYPMMLSDGILAVAIIDLRSGTFEWMNVADRFSGHGTRSPKEAGSANRLMARLFERYPRVGFYSSK